MGIDVTVNPYDGKLPDEKVQKYYKEYWNVADEEAVEVGVPDKFTVQCVRKFIWSNGNYMIKKVF